MSRDTSTGSNFQSIVEACLRKASEEDGFKMTKEKVVGEKPGGTGKHRIDWELTSEKNPDLKGLVSCKYQERGGTAEEKVVYEVIKLLHTMEVDPKYVHAWLALGGEGWSDSIKNFITNELQKWIPQSKKKITIFMTPNELIASRIKLSDFQDPTSVQ